MHSTHDGAFSPVNSTSCYQLGLCKLLVFFNCDGIHSYFVEEISGILCLVSLSCSIGLHTFSTCDGAFSPVNSFFFKNWARANCQCFKWWWKIHSYVVKEVSGICAHSICLAQLDLIYSNRDGAFSLVNSTSCYFLGLCTLSVFLIVTEFTPTLLKQFLKLCARSVYLA